MLSKNHLDNLSEILESLQWLIQPDTVLTGRFTPDTRTADLDSVREAINEARIEAMISSHTPYTHRWTTYHQYCLSTDRLGGS